MSSSNIIDAGNIFIEIRESYLPEAVNKMLFTVADAVKREAILNADRHTKTGRLVSSIRIIKTESGYEVKSLGSVAKYNMPVHFGREAKEVTKSKPMVFMYKGIKMFARRVSHPGYKGDKFMTNAADEVRSKMSSILGSIK